MRAEASAVAGSEFTQQSGPRDQNHCLHSVDGEGEGILPGVTQLVSGRACLAPEPVCHTPPTFPYPM